MAGGAHQWGRFDVALDGAHPLLRVVASTMNLRSRLTGIATGDQGIFITPRVVRASGRLSRVAADGGYRAVAAGEARRRAVVSASSASSTSARRWERHGVLRTIVLMWQLRLAYFLGADPARLALRYHASQLRD